MTKTIKWQIKVRSKREISWTHFAYLPTEFKNNFLKHTKHKGWTNNDWLDKWSKEDFGMKSMDTWDDLFELKKAIRAKYKEEYPELHLIVDEEKEMDTMGWTRVWLANHMKKEIELCLQKLK